MKLSPRTTFPELFAAPFWYFIYKVEITYQISRDPYLIYKYKALYSIQTILQYVWHPRLWQSHTPVGVMSGWQDPISW